MMYRRRHRRAQEPAELNITTFMNLMVILVPFLLITAVFSRLAILELNVPSAENQLNEEPPALGLEVVVRNQSIIVGDRSTGVLTELPNVDGAYDFSGLNTFLRRVKTSFPDTRDATLLLEPDVSYEVLVQVMDVVREHHEVETGEMVRYELFPEIAIGDAPAMASVNGS